MKQLFFLLACWPVLYSQAQNTDTWNGKQCAVVLTYDDAIDVDLDHAIPALDSLGLKATFYLIGSSPVVARRMNEWRAVAREGHELGNHSLYHPCDGNRPGRSFVQPDYDLSKYTVNRAVNEVRMNNVLLNAIDGKTKRTFAYPCGDLTIGDTPFYNGLRKDFVAARGVRSAMDPIGKVDLDNIDCYGINGQTAEQMIDLVKKAMASHTLLVFLFHGVGGGHSINVGLNEHSQLLHYLKEHEREIWIAPMVEVAEYVRAYQSNAAATAGPSPAAIREWPKVELHLHLDCSLSYEVVKNIDPSISPEAYREGFIAPDRCTNLADYIARAIKAVDLMQTKEQLRLATLDLFDQLQKDHVIYAEIRYAPLLHLKKGLTPEQAVAAVNDAVSEGIAKTGIQVGVLLCTLRHYTAEQSMETVRLVEQFKGTHIVGFDIAGDEAGYPITNHIAAFEYARAKHIPCTAHAGEAAGPQSVRETLEHFHPSRIGHGVRSFEDSNVVALVKQQHILLEVCPTSNLQTNIYDQMQDHPVDKLHRSGVSLNINTDCRTISNTTLDKEYQRVEDVFRWTKADFLACNLDAVDHAFTSEKNKKMLREMLIKEYGAK